MTYALYLCYVRVIIGRGRKLSFGGGGGGGGANMHSDRLSGPF